MWLGAIGRHGGPPIVWISLLVIASRTHAQGAIDLSVRDLRIMPPTVESGSFVNILMLVHAELQDGRTLRPDLSTNTDVYRVHMFLSSDPTLDHMQDRELMQLPASFNGVNQNVEVSGVIDLSGPGLRIPLLHHDHADHRYCGPVYIIGIVDGPNAPGSIDETDETNNEASQRITIMCPGDLWGLADFEFDLGPQQTELYQSTTTPVMVNVTVYNTATNSSHSPGRAHYKLSLLLHDSADPGTGSPLEVTQPGTTYVDMRDPLQGLGPGQRTHIYSATMWIDGEKFTSNPGYEFLLLRVGFPDDSEIEETVTANNYAAKPIQISILSRFQQTDFQVSTEFSVRQNVANNRVILADGSVIPVSDYDIRWKVTADDTLSFVGEIDLMTALANTMITTLYWSKDDRWDENEDIESTIPLEINAKAPHLILASGTEPLAEPEDRSYCGTVYAIVFTRQPVALVKERLKFNSLGYDLVTLRCDPTDILGLTDVKLLHAPKMWVGVETPVSMEITVSCTATDCSAFTQGKVNFQLKLLLGDSPVHSSQTELVRISNNGEADMTENGLESSLTDRRTTFILTAPVTAQAGQCGAAMYLGVELLRADGMAEAYTENDFIAVQLPPMQCDDTAPSVDISVLTFALAGPSPTLSVGRYRGFDLSVNIELTNAKTLEETQWPHFEFSLMLSTDAMLDDADVVIPYRLTQCQRDTLTAGYSTTTHVDLGDPAGFWLPPVGLEKYCGRTVYVGVFLDSYDPHPGDETFGQLEETLETNNVAWTLLSMSIGGLHCSQYNAVDNTPTPWPRGEVDLIW